MKNVFANHVTLFWYCVYIQCMFVYRSCLLQQRLCLRSAFLSLAASEKTDHCGRHPACNYQRWDISEAFVRKYNFTSWRCCSTIQVYEYTSVSYDHASWKLYLKSQSTWTRGFRNQSQQQEAFWAQSSSEYRYQRASSYQCRNNCHLHTFLQLSICCQASKSVSTGPRGCKPIKKQDFSESMP